MEYLIECTCGHKLSRHQWNGCDVSACACPLDKAAALEDAIRSTRWNPEAGRTSTQAAEG